MYERFRECPNSPLKRRWSAQAGVPSQDCREYLLQTTMGSVGAWRVLKGTAFEKTVYLPTRVVSCLKSASPSVYIFHNSLAGIFQREDPSRDKETLRGPYVFSTFSLLFPLFSKNHCTSDINRNPLNYFSFMKDSFSQSPTRYLRSFSASPV